MRKTRANIFRDIYYQPYEDCTRLKLYSSSKGVISSCFNMQILLYDIVSEQSHCLCYVEQCDIFLYLSFFNLYENKLIENNVSIQKLIFYFVDCELFCLRKC